MFTIYLLKFCTDYDKICIIIFRQDMLMKFLFLFATKLRYFLVEIPPIFFYILCIKYNDGVKGVFKLYPLMVLLCACMIFMLLFLFRAVIISYEELYAFGLFSSKERATIKKDRAIVVTLLKHKRICVELFGFNDDGEESYAWLKNDVPAEINLFRAKTNGSKKTAVKIFNYFGVEAEDVERALENDGIAADTEDFKLTSSVENGFKSIRLDFKKTL